MLQLVVKGHTNQEIAQKLFISVKTVEAHKSNMMRKLKLRTRAQLMKYAINKGLLEL